MALYYGGTTVQLLGYVDFDFVGDVDSQRSTTGCLHFEKWSCDLDVKTVKDSRLIDDRGRVYCSDRILQVNMAERFFERAREGARGSVTV